MERRFYLRGLGLGIAVTAVIMGIITSRDSKMSDKEIIARAKELGMVENTVLSEDIDEAPEEMGKSEAGSEDTGGSGGESTTGDDEDDSERNSTDAGDTVPSGEVNEAGDMAGAGETDVEEESNEPENPGDDMTAENPIEASGQESGIAREDDAEPGTEEDARDLITSAAVKTITVNSGDGSHTVAKKLADVGVITSADTFDAFLCQNGYDKKLRTGTFSIPADASDEQIARIVTGAE